VYDVSQQKDWYLWTLDSNRYPNQGSKSTEFGSNVLLNRKTPVNDEKFYNKGYGMYVAPLDDSIRIEVQGTQPFLVTSSLSDVIYILSPLQSTPPHPCASLLLMATNGLLILDILLKT
jgi:hypothetical protein